MGTRQSGEHRGVGVLSVCVFNGEKDVNVCTCKDSGLISIIFVIVGVVSVSV